MKTRSMCRFNCILNANKKNLPEKIYTTRPRSTRVTFKSTNYIKLDFCLQ